MYMSPLCLASAYNHLTLPSSLFCTCQYGVWNTEEGRVMERQNGQEDELTHAVHLCQDKTNLESENHLIRPIADKERDCQEMILLVFKPQVTGSCHTKTEGMLAETHR